MFSVSQKEDICLAMNSQMPIGRALNQHVMFYEDDFIIQPNMLEDGNGSACWPVILLPIKIADLNKAGYRVRTKDGLTFKWYDMHWEASLTVNQDGDFNFDWKCFNNYQPTYKIKSYSMLYKPMAMMARFEIVRKDDPDKIKTLYNSYDFVKSFFNGLKSIHSLTIGIDYV